MREPTKQEALLLEKCFQTAKDNGVPKDQAQRLVEFGYFPYPWQWKFHSAAREADRPNGPVQIGVGGSRGPGKSHAIFSQITLDDCQRQPNLKALFLRQTGKAAKESMEDLVARVLVNKVQFEHTQSVLRFPNGSKVILGGFKDEKDIDKYIGIEYDVIGIEEENQLSEQKVEMLRGSLRTSKENWRPRLYASFNPGGLGHSYVKATFVEPYKSGLEKSTRFIPATFRDNPNLNTEYIDYLLGLSGQLGKAWRDGDFDIMAGQYFTEWNPKIHVIEPFDIPLDWKRICSLDYGYTAPSALYWCAVRPDGRLVFYRELYKRGLTFTQLAEEFVALTGANEKIDYLVADPSIWNKDGKNQEGLSGAEIFERRVAELTRNSTHRGVRLERGNNDRINGWRTLREKMRPFSMEIEGLGVQTVSNFEVFDTCYDLIRTMPIQVHDEHNPEDLDTEIEDHGPDSVRYLIQSRPAPSKTKELLDKQSFDKMIKKRDQSGRGKKMLFYK